MKNRVKLIVALLASVLVVCGMFTLTSFAEDGDSTSAATHTHSWRAKTTEEANKVMVKCDPSDESMDCWFWNHITLNAADMVYDGEAYDYESLVSFDVTNNNSKNPEMLHDGIAYSALEFYKAGVQQTKENALKEAVEVGDYVVKAHLVDTVTNTAIPNSEMTATFRIKEFKVQFTHKFLPGQDITGTETIDNKALDDDLFTMYEYLNLEKRNSEYTYKTPVNVGRYRVKAHLYEPVLDEKGEVVDADEIGVAYGECEIRKATADDVRFDVYAVKNVKKALAEIDPEAVQFNDYKQYTEVVSKLEAEGYLANSDNVVYGDAVLIVPIIGKDNNKVVYSPALYGLKTVKYGRLGKLPYIPGITKLPVGNENRLIVTLSASRNNEKISVPVFVKVTKADPKVIVKPAARENLVFTDRYQKLVTPGVAKGGTIEYTMVAADTETDNLNMDSLNWSKNVPTAIKEGTYYVLYRVKAANNNYNTKLGEKIEVKIAAEASDESAQPAGDDEEEFDWLAPGKVKNLKVTKRTEGSVKFRFKRVSDATKYEYVIMSRSGKTVKGELDQKVSRYISGEVDSGLKSKTWYKVKVRAVYDENTEAEDGTLMVVHHYGKWSKVAKFRTK